jgi:hypothetical protein
MSNEIWKMIPFFLPDKVPMKILLLCLVVLLGGIAAAQKPKPGTVDTALLRTKLKAAFSDHLAIIKHETTRRSNWHGGQLFWLVYVQPKRVGHFSIKYRYNYNGSLYSHVERELPFRVGKQGCPRGPQGHGLYSKFCLGDTIILPIAIENFTAHEFSLKFTDEDVRDEPFSASADQASVERPTNPVADHLDYISSSSHVSPHRAGGYTLHRYATFEARQPGRFNLALTNGENRPVAIPELGGYPIIVVERTNPITAIAGRENVEGFSKGYDGREYSSSTGGGTSYLSNVIILQTGDRFTFEYGSEIHSRDDEWKERADKTFGQQSEKPPVIHKSPFAFDPDWNYNEWIKEYLP